MSIIQIYTIIIEDNTLTFYEFKQDFLCYLQFLRDHSISVSSTSVRHARRQRSMKRSASRVSSASQVIYESSDCLVRISKILTQVEHILYKITSHISWFLLPTGNVLIRDDQEENFPAIPFHASSPSFQHFSHSSFMTFLHVFHLYLLTLQIKSPIGMLFQPNCRNFFN